MKVRIGLIVLMIGFVLLPFLFFAQTQTKSTEEYVCPPCSCGSDDKVHNAPGSCPACGMALVKKSQTPPQTKQMKAAILIFEGVQIIDFTGPYEVLGQAGIETFTVAEKTEPMKTSMGLTVTAAYTLENAPAADILLVPGGSVDPHVANKKIISWIQQRANSSQYVLSVCNGAFFLAEAGLLDGKEATTFYGLIEELKTNYPKVRVISNKRFADNGKIITTAGLSSGIDGTLYLISKIQGQGRAQQVALHMEYDWKADSNYARANFADKYLRRMLNQGLQWEVPNQTAFKIISTAGTAERWKAEFEFHANATQTEIRNDLEGKLEQYGKWTRDQSGRWNFTGDNGEKWSGSLDVAPVGGQQNVFKVTLQIQRA